MKYIGNVIRPPGEARSFIVQVTLGCSHNKCTFCPAYKTKPFSVRDIDEVYKEIYDHRAMIKRLFLADGDVLGLPFNILQDLFEYINRTCPHIIRIGLYGSILNVKNISVDQLKCLKRLNLGVLYTGIESGSDDVLREIRKGITAKDIKEQLLKVKEAGIKRVVTVLLGIGGRDRSIEHAAHTADILTEIQPEQAAVLTTMIVPPTSLYNKMQQDQFSLPNKYELLEELKIILQRSVFERTLFLTDHASNYVSLRLRLPKEKQKGIEIINAAQDDETKMREEYLRGL